MKITFLILVISVLQASAGVFSQNQKVTLDVKNACFEKILTDIEKQTGYTFLYSITDVESISQRDIKVKEKSLFLILDDCLKGTNLKYNVIDKTVVIIPKKKAANTGDQKKQDKKTVKGKVVDEKGNPLPGVSVIIKGTSVGVSTDTKGQFTLELPKDEKGITLLFSFIGMEKKEVKLKGQKDQKQLKIVLKDKKEALDEVIINGFKSVKKEHFTGNATVVTKKDILKANPRSVISALEIFDPSFRIKENSRWGSDPNAMPEFNIRGESSIGMNRGVDVEKMKQTQRVSLKDNPNLPVFILDGFEVGVDKIYDMDMNRISNITILKDAAATSLYGSRAANGVILVTTVAPKPGELRVNYNLNVSCQLPDLDDYNLCNAEEKLEAEKFAGLYSSEGLDAITKYQEYLVKRNHVKAGYDTDWLSQPLKSVINHKHSIFMEGGSDALRYGIDLSYDKNDGVMKGAHRNRRGVGFTVSYNHDGVIVKNQFSYFSVRAENSPYGSFSEYVRMSPFDPIYDENGEMLRTYRLGGYDTEKNPLYNVRYGSYDGRNKKDGFIDNFSAEFKLIEALRFKTQFSYQNTRDGNNTFIDPKEAQFDNKPIEQKGELTKYHSESESCNFKFLMYYTKNKNNHFVNAVFGCDLNESKNRTHNTLYEGFQIGSFNSPKYAAAQNDKTKYNEDKSRTCGFISSINYSYKNTYLLDASFRYDGSSKFGANKRFAPFWSLGTGINIHKLGFMQSMPFISLFKIRGSYGSVGKVNFPSYTAITTYYFNEEHWSRTGCVSNLLALGNENLKWETTDTFDIGFDLNLNNGKINLRGTYYKKLTKDLISDLYLRRSSGFDRYKINSGEIENEGYELSINAIVLRTDKLIARVFGNWSSNKNRITKLSEAMEEYNNEINELYDKTRDACYYYRDYKDLRMRPIQQYYVGASTTAIYAVKSDGIDPCTGRERFVRKDGTPTYTWSANDQIVCGDRLPDGKGSFGFNIGYDGFYINTAFTYEYGGQEYNTTVLNKVESVSIKSTNVDKRFLYDRWKKPGDVSRYLDIVVQRIPRPTSRAIQDKNVVSFNSICVGYDFKKSFVSRFGLSKMGLSFNMNDIKRWSSVKNERGLNYPYARNCSLTLNMSF